MQTITMEVTPAIATEWLKKNSANRLLKDEQVKALARAMKANRFYSTHQGIAFYEDGTLADGQHRLHAIVQSQTTQKLLVTMNLPKDAIAAIDVGAKRGMHDVMKILDYPEWMTRDPIAIARALMSKLINTREAHLFHDVVDYMNRHAESIRFANELTITKRRRLTHAVVAASYVCAYEAGESKAKIRRFAEILASGEISAKHENSAIRAREYLLTSGAAFSGVDRLDTAKRLHRALWAFCREEPLAKLQAQSEFKYPIPE